MTDEAAKPEPRQRRAPLRWLARQGPALAGLAILIGAAGYWYYRTGELAPETYGRIYVESPEVYTRQRLVNDRLAQDAWLNRQLATIDAETTAFIETWSKQRLALGVALTTGPGRGGGSGAPPPAGSDPDPAGAAAGGEATPVATPAPWWSETPELPFQALFDLKASARDKIRQLILENALDDRHDLSGNTVYGLKFDTAIVPGSNTRLRPTVIVKMNVDPFPSPEDGAADPAVIERAIALGAAGLPMTDHVEAFARLRRHFENWHRNIGVRLSDYLEGAVCRGDEAPISVALPDSVKERVEVLARSFNVGWDSYGEKRDVFATSAQSSPTAPEQPISLLEACLEANIEPTQDYFPPQIDAAVRHVLSLPNQDTSNVTRQLVRNGMYESYLAEAACHATYGEPEDARFIDFRVALPAPWGSLFHLNVDLDPVGLEVAPRVRPLLMTETNLDAALSDRVPALVLQQRCGVVERDEGAEALECSQPSDDGRHVYVYEETSGDRSDPSDTPIALSETQLAALYRAAPETTFCAGKGQYQPEQLAPEGACTESFEGRRIAFQSGLFEFANRVREIDTYAYAAFPRGDVSGVISEAGRSAGVSLGTRAPGGTVMADVSESDRERTVEARPMLINFAAGADSGEMFDFGWTVVREGRKRPMMASQLVLVSVPAYLDEITMEVTKGWLDSDKGLSEGESWIELPFEERIDRLIAEPETVTSTVHLPPDYQALDSLVAPEASRLGPLINEDAMKCSNSTAAGDALPSIEVVSGEAPSIVIPGARLWRSTVVTLGGHKAAEIEVMPDMRGIIARFDEVVLAERSGGPVTDPELDLIVWTSEGRDVLPDFAKLRPGHVPETETTETPIRAGTED